MYKYEKYFARGGSCPKTVFKCHPQEALRPSVCIDADTVPGSIFGCVEWIAADLCTEGLISHESDELHMFVGGNPADHENLNAEIDFQLENDHLVFSETSFVYVPAGCAHNIVSVKGLTRPILHYVMHSSAGFYRSSPAEATAPVGKYANNRVVRFERRGGNRTNTPPPEGFLTRLLWIDGERLAGAPYTESVWFHTTNETGPAPHTHDDFDEFVAFIGGDPDHPEELNGDISLMIEDETIHTDKSTIIYVPRGVLHSPLLVHRLDRDIMHFSGGNGGDYVRDKVIEE